MGRRCNLNRFMEPFAAAERHVPQWSLDLFERTCVALELDMLGRQAFEGENSFSRQAKQKQEAKRVD